MRVRSSLLSFLLALMPAPLFAQVAAELRGTVVDPTGATVGGAVVELKQASTGVVLYGVSDKTGDFVFTHLVPGEYAVNARASGFHPTEVRGVPVATGETSTLVVHLAVAGADTVTVTADAPLLQASTSDVSTVISGANVQALPLNTRNFVQLATLAPGVELPPGQLLPRINGGRPRTNEYLFDGISALQPEPGQVAFFPLIDDIAEFTVESNNVPAEFGRFNGGVVNVSTRAGTSTLHGSLFEYFRNEDLNARNFFAQNGARPEYRRNLYGATLGGPALRQKLFFFADYQGIKQLVGRTLISTVPTLAERGGNFAGVSHIYDPGTTTVVAGKYVRTEFPGDTINTPLDPAAVALLKRIPQPTSSGAANNYTRTANDADHQNQFDVRVDGVLDGKDRGFARYTYYSEVEQPVTYFPDGSGPAPPTVFGTTGAAGLSNILGQQAVIDETHTFTSRLLNDARLGYTRRGNTISGPQLATAASAALGIPGIPTNAAFSNALPLFTFTGFQQLGPAASTFAQYQTGVWQFVDTVEYVRGRHAWKAGADLRWYQLNAVSPPNPTGSFAFTTTGTNQQGVTGSGNALASFLLGQVDTFTIDLQTSKIKPRDHIFEYFVQDDWHASANLTLNLGLRYTLHLPSTEKTNQGAVFNLATQQLDYVGVNGNPRSARNTHYGNVAPRVGLSYKLTPATVLRAGFGIVFIDQSGITTPFTVPQFPFIQNVAQRTQDSVNAAFALSSGPTVTPIPLTPAAGLGQSVYTVNRSAGSGYVEQWNLAVQRQVRRNLSVELTYAGSHIVHLGIPDSNLNQLTTAQLAQGASLQTQVTNPYYGQLPASSSIGGKTVSQAQLLKPYPRFLNVATYRANSGTSNYNGAEVKVEQRSDLGLTLLFGYTHAKLIDDASSVFSTTVLSSPNSSSLIAADTFNPRLERDASAGDLNNVTTAGVLYDLPAGRGHRFASGGATAYALGGWSVNAITVVQSGLPVTITQATNNNAFAGFVLQRPNVSGNPALDKSVRSPLKFFNTSAFSTAPQFTLGNASRNPVRGPAYRDLDIALVKHTPIGDHLNTEFRAELFNITNTPGFSQPNGSFGSAAFGTITSTVTDPRVVQFALKVGF